MATKTANTNASKKEFTLKQVFALWKRKSKNGNYYFSGVYEGGQLLKGFFNTNKQNPKEPDLRIYIQAETGELSKEEFLSMWCNATENGKKYLSGKLSGKRVVGFINANATDENKQPYISIYWSDDPEVKKVETQETKPKYNKKEKQKFEEIETDDLPF